MIKLFQVLPAQRFTVVWLLFASLLAFPVWGSEETQSDYRLGSGYALGNSGLRLGGYANAEILAAGKAPWSFNTSDLSLFITWDNGSPIRFFSEVESADTFSAGEHQSLTTRNAHLEAERFYFDGLVNDKLTVRFGKFLTPIGQWNLLHASPLVWTSHRPVATENLFPSHISGAMLHGALLVANQQLEYAFYGDVTDKMDPHRDRATLHEAFGAHLRYHWNDNLQTGVSFSDFVGKDEIEGIQSSYSEYKEEKNSRYFLAGFDVLWNYKKYEIRSEIAYRSKGEHEGDKALWQGYLQGVSPLIQHLFLVGRYEVFQQTFDKAGQVGVVGLAFRPTPPLVWKLEYRMGSHNDVLAPDGLAASVAVLF